MAANSFALSTRNAGIQAIITDLGAGAILESRLGPVPANTAAALVGGNTLLSTLTFPGAIGVIENGTLNLTEAGVTQNSANHVSGMPTFGLFKTAAGVVKWRAEYNVAGGFTATAVVNGTDVVPSTLTLADANV